jgi:hypothetical protein
VADDGTTGRIGVYPGSFDPVTVAHLHVAEVARDQCGLTRVELSISVGALGKDDGDLSPVDERLDRIAALGAARPWLAGRRTEARLLADVAEGFDVLIVGADKWHQLLDPSWYGSVEARDDALARLPVVAVAPRAGWALPTGDTGAGAIPGLEVVVLDTDPAHHHVSASDVRAGRDDWRARP